MQTIAQSEQIIKDLMARIQELEESNTIVDTLLYLLEQKDERIRELEARESDRVRARASKHLKV